MDSLFHRLRAESNRFETARRTQCLGVLFHEELRLVASKKSVMILFEKLDQKTFIAARSL
jgi:hypothetical protein